MKLIRIALIFIITVLLLISIVLFLLNYYLSTRTNQNLFYFPHLIVQSLKQPSITSDRLNILILGLDYRDDLLEKTETTDTIIFASYSLESNKLHLISLPRDLYDQQLQLKINQIFPESKKQNFPISFIKTNFSRILGQPLDRVLILTTRNLSTLVDLIGGVDVNLDYEYTDNQYPNPEYISNPSPDIPVYITVHFNQGLNHIDSSNIAAFVRSRHGSDDPSLGGTDLGRIERQQLLINSLIEKIRQPSFFKNTSTLIKLYRFWHQDLLTDLSDNDILSLINRQKSQLLNLSLERSSLPVGTNSQTGIIYHPSRFSSSQWVFLPTDPSWQQFHLHIANQIND